MMRQFTLAACCLSGSVALAGHAQQPAPPAQLTVENSQRSNAESPKVARPSSRQLRQAEDAYLAGARLLDHRDMAKAEAQFAKAVALNPANADYIQAAALAHEHRVSELVLQAGRERLSGHSSKADALLTEARKLDPENRIVTQHADAAAPDTVFRPEIQSEGDASNAWRLTAPTLAGPVTLLPDTGKQSFQISADAQQTIRQVLSRYGIRATFDASVQAKRVRFNLEDITYDQASAILFQMTDTFAVPLDPHTVLIAADTTENRQRLERQLQETIYVPGFSTEQMTELGNVVRTVFDVKQATVQNGSGSLALRAPEDTLTAVNLTLADLIDGGAEVLLDLRLYTVDRTRQRDIGGHLPQQIGVYNIESEANKLVENNQALVQQAISQGLIPADASNIAIAIALLSSGLVQSTLLSNTIGYFGGGITATGVTVPSTTFNLALNSSDTRALDSVQLRVGDRQSGTFRSGTRYPITTSTYTNTSGVSASLAGTTINGVSVQSLLNQSGGLAGSVTIPQIQYEDLGLTLKATPAVQRSGLVRLKLDLKIEALVGNSLNDIPILANRQYSSDVTVRDGETTLLASSLSRSESAAVSGTPGLSELPGFQGAAADKATDMDTSELVLLITPHIVRHRSNETAGPRIAFNQRLPN